MASNTRWTNLTPYRLVQSATGLTWSVWWARSRRKKVNEGKVNSQRTRRTDVTSARKNQADKEKNTEGKESGKSPFDNSQLEGEDEMDWMQEEVWEGLYG